MTDLIDFLRERLADDERAAVETGASGHPAWCVVVTDEPSSPTPEQAAHITRHGPWKVLREVDAKRRILAEHDDTGSGEWCELDGQRYPCLTFRLLALPYSDHPNYLPAWRPA